MRGRTLNHSFIILDEAQNTTPEQMKMFLTRIGFGSKAVITGDVTQIDLPRGQKSGLIERAQVLADVRGIAFTAVPGRRRGAPSAGAEASSTPMSARPARTVSSGAPQAVAVGAVRRADADGLPSRGAVPPLGRAALEQPAADRGAHRRCGAKGAR